MYLKSLEMQGFKSFPDKYKLDFDKGLTAVVGPNGSGKSNIGDAMRWAFGELSSKNLRSEKMDQVIFAGSEKRKSGGFAQVTLNIDNSDRTLGVDSDIVSVSRKLYRNGNGDNEYYINGAKVQHKDIIELFMDTGLGRKGYSIIGRKKIEELVSDRSSDRREIFEEAAGISKFKYKKEKAQQKLADTENEMLRLQDIIGELEARVEPLRIQSEKAKKFREFDEEKRRLEVSVWVRKLDELTENISATDDRLLVYNTEHENLSRELDELEEMIETCYAKRAKASENIELIREKIHSAQLENSSASAQIAVLENDIKHIEEAIEATKAAVEQTERSAEDIQKKIAEKTAEAQELDKTASEVSQYAAETESELARVLQQSDEFGKNVNSANSELNELYIKKSELSYRCENAKNLIAEIEEASETSVIEEQQTLKLIENAQAEKSELDEAIAKADEELTEYNNKLGGYRMLHQKKTQNLEDAEKAYSGLELKLHELQQRQRILNDLENSMDGFSKSTRHILRASKQGRLKGVFGSVAQIVTVESQYSLAIETALGAALQNIVVDNEETAKRGINLLKEAGAGRATFLPITSVKGYELNESGLEAQEGFVAVASRLVKFDSKFSTIINSLLGKVVIAENIDLAAVIAKKYGYKFRIVTLDGQVINVSGSFTGGSSSRSAGILTRKNEIQELGEEIEKLSAERDAMKKKRTDLNQEVQKLFYDMEGVRENINTVSGDKIRFEGELKRITELSVGYETRLSEIRSDNQNYKQRLENAVSEIDNSQLQLAELEKRISYTEQSIRSSQDLMENARENREMLSAKLSELKIRETELAKDSQSCREAVEALNREIQETSGSKDELSDRIMSLKTQIDDKNSEIEDIKAKIAGSDGVIAAFNEGIIREQQDFNKFDMQAAEHRHDQKVKNEEKEGVSKEIVRVTEKRTTLQSDFDKIITELWEQYEMSRNDACEFAQDIEDMTAANRRLNELKSKIRGLGTVNLEAIDEYVQVSERYRLMSEQFGDVQRSKNEIERIIAELTESMKQKFTENFEKINENFKQIFVELFGGGKGELRLTDPDNVLECGIDIDAVPPGKVINNRSQLSDGEKAFVAICIYFSILKVHPSPFCLLDEVDAPLDDVNVTRYARYLKNFAEDTQFILITHRRGTMEESDVLYGVTMQEKGVSKLLKMNASEGADIAAE